MSYTYNFVVTSHGIEVMYCHGIEIMYSKYVSRFMKAVTDSFLPTSSSHGGSTEPVQVLGSIKRFRLDVIPNLHLSSWATQLCPFLSTTEQTPGYVYLSLTVTEPTPLCTTLKILSKTFQNSVIVPSCQLFHA